MHLGAGEKAGGGGNAGHLPGASGSLSGTGGKERQGGNVSAPCSPLQNPKL